jgi:hypothetical protein
MPRFSRERVRLCIRKRRSKQKREIGRENRRGIDEAICIQSKTCFEAAAPFLTLSRCFPTARIMLLQPRSNGISCCAFVIQVRSSSAILEAFTYWHHNSWMDSYNRNQQIPIVLAGREREIHRRANTKHNSDRMMQKPRLYVRRHPALFN